MRKILCLLMLLALGLVANGCSDSSDSSRDSSTKVYAGGACYSSSGPAIPVVWGNSTDAEKLPTEFGDGGVESVCAVGSDFYISGSELFINEHIAYMLPVYWKNGEKVRLETLGNAADSIAIKIKVVNNVVHVAGAVASVTMSPLPAYWKDGHLTTLPVIDEVKGGLVNAMCIEGQNAYCGGFCVVPTDSGAYSVGSYWKNGDRTDLENPVRTEFDSEAIVWGIAMDNDDLYVAGTVIYSDGENRFEKPVYWKNDVAVPLIPIDNDDIGSADDIAVHNGSVYVVGYYVKDDKNKPVLWVDGQMQELSMIDSNLVGSARCIAIVDSMVYISGDTTKMEDPEAEPPVLSTHACYWVDGKRVDLKGLTEDATPMDEPGEKIEMDGIAFAVDVMKD